MATLLAGFLKDIIWRNKNISIRSKTRIYKICVTPAITYAAETRVKTKATKHHTTEMRMLRTISGYMLCDLQQNSNTRELRKVEDVVR